MKTFNYLFASLSKSDQYDLVSGTNSRMAWWFLFISGYLILHSFNLFNPTSYTLVYLLFIFSFLAVVLVNTIFPKNLPDYFQVCVLLPNIMSCCLLLYHSQFHNFFFVIEDQCSKCSRATQKNRPPLVCSISFIAVW